MTFDWFAVDREVGRDLIAIEPLMREWEQLFLGREAATAPMGLLVSIMGAESELRFVAPVFVGTTPDYAIALETIEAAHARYAVTGTLTLVA